MVASSEHQLPKYWKIGHFVVVVVDDDDHIGKEINSTASTLSAWFACVQVRKC